MANSKQFKASIVLGGVVAGSLKTAFGTAEGGVKRIGDAVTALTKRQQMLGNAIQTFGRQGRDVDRVRDSYSQVTRQIEKLQQAQQRLNAIEQASIRNREKLDSLIGKMPGGHLLGTAASALGVGAGLRAYEKINDAETDLRVALMDKSGNVPKQFEQIRQTAIGLHNILPGTLADFHNVAVALKENGTSAEVIANGGLVAAAKLGVVMKMPVESAAEMTAKLREAFQLSEGELEKMADLSQRAKFGFGLKPDDLLLGAKYYGGSLGSLKLHGADDVKKIYALQGQAAQNGIDGSTFGTNFSMLLTRMATLPMTLAKHSAMMKKTNEILKKNHVSLDFFDKKGKFGGIENMVAQLEKLQKIKSDQERAEVLKNLFGQEGGRPAELISRKGTAGYQSAIRAMDDQASLQQRTNALTQSFSNKVKALGGSIETAIGMAFEPLGDALIPIINRMNMVVSHGIMPWIEHNKKLVGTVTAVVSGLVALRAATLALRIGGLLLNGGLLNIAKGLVGIQAAAAVATVESGVAATAAAGMGATVAGAFAGIAAIAWPVVGIVAALAVGALLVRKYWEPIKAWFIGLGQGIAQTVGPAIDELGTDLAPLGSAFKVIGGAIAYVWRWFTKLLDPMHATNAQLQAAQSNGVSFGRVIGIALASVVRMVDFGVTAINWLGTAIGETAGWVSINLPAAWDTLKAKVGAVIDWIMEKLKPLREAMNWLGQESDNLGATAAAKRVGSALASAWDWATGKDGKSNAPTVPARIAPPMATARSGGASAPTIQQHNVFHVTQLPGENGEAFARRVAALNQHQTGVQQRGQLIDGVGG